VIEEYPDSEYARSAILKFDLAFNHLAGKEMEIGRYYLKRGNYSSSINRFRVVVEQYQTTTHTPEALHRLVEA
jgi:outer membrane protein assembly factor BamD